MHRAAHCPKEPPHSHFVLAQEVPLQAAAAITAHLVALVPFLTLLHICLSSGESCGTRVKNELQQVLQVSDSPQGWRRKSLSLFPPTSFSVRTVHGVISSSLRTPSTAFRSLSPHPRDHTEEASPARIINETVDGGRPEVEDTITYLVFKYLMPVSVQEKKRNEYERARGVDSSCIPKPVCSLPQDLGRRQRRHQCLLAFLVKGGGREEEEEGTSGLNENCEVHRCREREREREHAHTSTYEREKVRSKLVWLRCCRLRWQPSDWENTHR